MAASIASPSAMHCRSTLSAHDQGFLEPPAEARRVVMAPAERIDLLIDFSEHAGEKILLQSDTFELMEFRVAGKKSGGGNSATTNTHAAEPPTESSSEISNVVPSKPAVGAFVRLMENQAVRTRRLTLDEKMDPKQQSMGMLLNNTPWHMPITEKPVIDTIEIWELVNLTEDSHPIHLHLVRFQILDRRAFDTFDFLDKGTFRFTGPADSSGSHRGWMEGHGPSRSRRGYPHRRSVYRFHRPVCVALSHPGA